MKLDPMVGDPFRVKLLTRILPADHRWQKTWFAQGFRQAIVHLRAQRQSEANHIYKDGPLRIRRKKHQELGGKVSGTPRPFR